MVTITTITDILFVFYLILFAVRIRDNSFSRSLYLGFIYR
jgi:hypothetical protein